MTRARKDRTLRELKKTIKREHAAGVAARRAAREALDRQDDALVQMLVEISEREDRDEDVGAARTQYETMKARADGTRSRIDAEDAFFATASSADVADLYMLLARHQDAIGDVGSVEEATRRIALLPTATAEDLRIIARFIDLGDRGCEVDEPK
jgi:hypothetical protein